MRGLVLAILAGLLALVPPAGAQAPLVPPGRAQVAAPQPLSIDAPTLPDTDIPARNAVVSLGLCSGTLIGAQIILTAAHCTRVLRAPRPPETRASTCSGLSRMASVVDPVWEDPQVWTPAGERRLTVYFGNRMNKPRMRRKVVAYALARCADVALLRMDVAVPLYVAQPLPVRTRPLDIGDLTRGAALLRHAGWGVEPPPVTQRRRQTGPVQSWGMNRCHLFALPPVRDATGNRVLQGDSGAPLLWSRGDGRETVVGVLWGMGLPDPETCGLPFPAPPPRFGAYTPTWRGPIPGTEATDIGAWIADMLARDPWPP